MTRRIRRLLILITLVAAMTLGGASAAFAGHPTGDHPGKSGAAGCFQAASNQKNNGTLNPNYNEATGNGNFTGVPDHAWDNPQNAWTRCPLP